MKCPWCKRQMDWQQVVEREDETYCGKCGGHITFFSQIIPPGPSGWDKGHREPIEVKEAAALGDDANREMFGDETAELMDLGILSPDIGNK